MMGSHRDALPWCQHNTVGAYLEIFFYLSFLVHLQEVLSLLAFLIVCQALMLVLLEIIQDFHFFRL